MPKSEKRVYGKGHLHLINCYCRDREQKLGEEKHRDLFCRLLEEVRVKFRFTVVGYVLMPDNFSLLMVEPLVDTAANSVETLLQRYQRRYNNSARSTEPVWENDYTDTHITGAERLETTLRTLHEAPVKAKLVESATEWEWSSARYYAGIMPDGVVTVERANG
jgi:putative transposase